MGRLAGERVREAREAAAVSQDEVALALGVSQQIVSNWEVGKTKIPDRHRQRVAELIGVTLADLGAWIAADEEQRHKATKRQLTETVRVMDRFVSQYEELGHTYRRLDDHTAKILDALEEVGRQQREMLRLLQAVLDRGA